MERLWAIFCGDSDCADNSAENCSLSFYTLISRYTCLNDILIISVDILLLLIPALIVIYKSVSKKPVRPSQSQSISLVQCVSGIFNGALGLVYLGLVLWKIIKRLDMDKTVLPLHGWVVMLFQGFTLLLLNVAVSVKSLVHQHIAALRFFLVLNFLFSGFLFVTSLWKAVSDKTVSIELVSDILSFPGAILFLFLAYQHQNCADSDSETNNGACYEPLPGKAYDENVTNFSRAGFFSKMSFWWLNRLMKRGNQKILEDKDIPLLRKEDQARTCHLIYVEAQRKRKQKGLSNSQSMVSIIISWKWKELVISGLFALVKIITACTGPLFLKAFIDVAEGKQAFKDEGYVLTAGLFLVKCLESLSERQWYFRTRLIGIQVRSMLSAAIYQKQLRLSNAAKIAHSSGEIVHYVTADAYRIGEFFYWSHQLWTTILQPCLILGVIYYSVGLATVAALATVILLVIASFPIVTLQHKYHSKLTVSQDRRLKAMTEALGNMRIFKLYAWEGHFKKVIEGIRKQELLWISKLQLVRGLYLVLFWISPILVPAITFWACYFLEISLTAGTLFTFLASVRIIQEPVRLFPDVAKAYIEAKVSLDRIEKFLDAAELENINIRQTCFNGELHQSIFISCNEISWDTDPSSKATVRNINLVIKSGEKVAICGEVGSGKSTLLAAILGEIPRTSGTVRVRGKIAYVSQTAWIQSGTIQENILFGSAMDPTRYHEVLQRCSLVKDLELLPFGDLTQIGERGINLSGGQKQRVQLARALYQDADIYLLDDPFSAVDAHTASSLFNDYVIEALSDKTVLLVTHQVDFLPVFNSILLMSAGEIIRADTYDHLLASSQEFQDLVNAHKTISGSTKHTDSTFRQIPGTSREKIEDDIEELQEPLQDQLIKKEERETGDTGFKPYIQYLRLNKGFLYFSMATIFHTTFILGQFVQNYWLAADIKNSNISRLTLYAVFSIISIFLVAPLLLRSFCVVQLGDKASESVFSILLTSLFRAPISFFDSTPIGRILTRVSSDLSIVDLELPARMTITLGSTMNAYFSFAVLAFVTWPVLFVIIPMVYLSIVLQRYYFKTAKELMRINGTSKSSIASQLTESISGAMTIRAFGEEDQFFLKNLNLIDANARAHFHTFAANEWLIQRLELQCAIVLSSTTLAMALLHLGASASGFIGMELSYGLSLNIFVVLSIQFQCFLSELIVSVERLEQYMHIPSEAPEVIECNRPAPNWPDSGKMEIYDLKVRYRPNAPLVLQGVTCTIEGGQKIGIVGRTGSGKTTLISAIFRLVEPTEGRIVVDDIDICTIGLHDIRAHFAIIPQDPTLFVGTVRYNLDPLSEHTDQEIWEVLEKCQLQEAVKEKEDGLNSPVAQDGSNWSMGQRQLFCLGRALLKRSRILVLDEATASIDNATDCILQKTIRTEFAECTVITVAHRIPSVMDCDKVMAISDGKLVEYDEPLKLMSKEGSLFAQLVNEYWSRTANSSNSYEI